MADNLARQLEDDGFNNELSRQIDNVVMLPLSQENKKKVADAIKEMISKGTNFQEDMLEGLGLAANDNSEMQQKILDTLGPAANDNSIENQIANIGSGFKPANDNTMSGVPNNIPSQQPINNQSTPSPVPPGEGNDGQQTNNTAQNEDIDPSQLKHDPRQVEKENEKKEEPQTNEQQKDPYQEEQNEAEGPENKEDLGLDNNPKNTEENEDKTDSPESEDTQGNEQSQETGEQPNGDGQSLGKKMALAMNGTPQEEKNEDDQEVPQRNVATQAFNKLRNKKEIAAKDQEIQQNQTRIKVMQNLITKKNKEKKKLEDEKKPYESLKTKLKWSLRGILAAQILIGFFAFIFMITIVLIPLALMLFGVSGSMNAWKAGIKLQIKLLEEKIKPIDEKIKVIDKDIASLQKNVKRFTNEIRQLNNQKQQLINQGLFQKRPQTN